MDQLHAAGSRHENCRDAPLIVHVIHKFQTGGMENGLVNLINGLPTGKFQHAIVCLTHSTDFEKRLEVSNVRIFELHKRAGKDMLMYVKFWRLLRALRPDVVHTRNIGTIDMSVVAAFAGVPLRVHGEHGWVAGDVHGSNRKYKLLRQFCDPAIHAYVAVSQDIATWLQDVIGVKEDKVHQIYNGVNTERFTPDGDSCRVPFDKTNDELVLIGTVARLDPIKGLNDLLAAFKKVLDSKPQLRPILRLAVVGGGPLFEELSGEICKKGLEKYVWLSGERSDIPEVLRSFDVFVLSSLNEGISNTVLEAMATELPVIATKVGGNSELIDPGTNGELVPAGCADELSDKILCLVDDPFLRKRIGEAARRCTTAKFSLKKMVSGYSAFYENNLVLINPKDRN